MKRSGAGDRVRHEWQVDGLVTVADGEVAPGRRGDIAVGAARPQDAVRRHGERVVAVGVGLDEDRGLPDDDGVGDRVLACTELAVAVDVGKDGAGDGDRVGRGRGDGGERKTQGEDDARATQADLRYHVRYWASTHRPFCALYIWASSGRRFLSWSHWMPTRLIAAGVFLTTSSAIQRHCDSAR